MDRKNKKVARAEARAFAAQLAEANRVHASPIPGRSLITQHSLPSATLASKPLNETGSLNPSLATPTSNPSLLPSRPIQSSPYLDDSLASQSHTSHMTVTPPSIAPDISPTSRTDTSLQFPSNTSSSAILSDQPLDSAPSPRLRSGRDENSALSFARPPTTSQLSQQRHQQQHLQFGSLSLDATSSSTISPNTTIPNQASPWTQPPDSLPAELQGDRERTWTDRTARGIVASSRPHIPAFSSLSPSPAGTSSGSPNLGHQTVQRPSYITRISSSTAGHSSPVPLLSHHSSSRSLHPPLSSSPQTPSPFSTSPFAVPGSKSFFLSSSYENHILDRQPGISASLSAADAFRGPASASVMNAGSFGGRRLEPEQEDDSDERDDAESDGEDFLPSSLNELLTDLEMERRLSRRGSNSHSGRPPLPMAQSSSSFSVGRSTAPGYGLPVHVTPSQNFDIGRTVGRERGKNEYGGVPNSLKADGSTATETSRDGASEDLLTPSRASITFLPDFGRRLAPPSTPSTSTVRGFNFPSLSSPNATFAFPSSQPLPAAPILPLSASFVNQAPYLNGNNAPNPWSPPTSHPNAFASNAMQHLPSSGHPLSNHFDSSPSSTNQPSPRAHQHLDPQQYPYQQQHSSAITSTSPSYHVLASHLPGTSLPPGLGFGLGRFARGMPFGSEVNGSRNQGNRETMVGTGGTDLRGTDPQPSSGTDGPVRADDHLVWGSIATGWGAGPYGGGRRSGGAMAGADQGEKRDDEDEFSGDVLFD